VDSLAKGARHFEGLGSLHRPITASSKESQAYFDQGLALTYGFNHDEATRSYAQAAVIDPSCASCFWGVALTLGPNYNVPMLPDRAAAAWAALLLARSLAPSATPVEQALIEALSKRYKGPEPLDPPAQQPFNEAYAAAMREVAKRFPNDLDVQVLFAESMMDVNPWKLWTLDGKANPGTEEIVGTLEFVLARDPQHPGANHYYIHAVEASQHPDKALASAARLPALMPAAGHVVHMPAHIYQRVGRYDEASEANRRAVAADQKYLSETTPPGYYPMYLGHNYGFLAFSASMEGRGDEALQAAAEVNKAIPPEMLTMMPGADFFISEQLLVMVRFARWDQILATPRPDPKFQVLTTLWLHAHGMALAAKGRADEAWKDHAELVKLGAAMPADLTAGLNPAKDVDAVAAKILEARIAQAEKNPQALALWAEAVALEDGLAYSEPADWFYPSRHFQGAALLAAGKAQQAEAVYREDLRRNPANGWSLFGLMQALEAQKKTQQAAAVQKEFQAAWQHADVKLASSVLR
jgi:tetratricopeptide (TPR) repeat protein